VVGECFLKAFLQFFKRKKQQQDNAFPHLETAINWGNAPSLSDVFLRRHGDAFLRRH